MEEGRRQAYLAALGVSLWTARYELPAALPSDELCFVPWQVEQVGTEVGGAEADSAPVATAAAPLPQEVSPPAPVTPKVATLAVAPVARPAQASGFPRFACFVQRLAPDVVGVVDLNNNLDLSAQEYRLLANIMRAMSGDVSNSPREQLRWPMYESNPRFPRDAEHARQALAALLAKQGAAKRYIVFGETLGVYVRAGLPQQTVRVGPTLAEILSQPAAKRQLWQAIHE